MSFQVIWLSEFLHRFSEFQSISHDVSKINDIPWFIIENIHNSVLGKRFSSYSFNWNANRSQYVHVSSPGLFWISQIQAHPSSFIIHISTNAWVHLLPRQGALDPFHVHLAQQQGHIQPSARYIMEYPLMCTCINSSSDAHFFEYLNQ